MVTTLFCDLVGFTALNESADPEDVDALLREYFARATRAIESHDGSVEKFIGDAVVGVFGAPVVHEDDPERAVRAGLRVIETLEGLTRPDGTPLQARIGVNTGEVLVRLDVHPASGRGLVVGDAVNVAARLQSTAAPMGVVVGPLTHELTSTTIDYRPLGPIGMPGKRSRVRAYLALGPVSRTGLRTLPSTSTPFVGRDAELTSLEEALEAAVGDGRSRKLLLLGEPGIGKSRLVLELARRLDAQAGMVTWRQGRCLPYGEGVAVWPLGEIVKGEAGVLDSDDVATVEARLERVLPEGAEGRWLAERLRPLLGLEAPQADLDENIAAWIRFLELRCRRGPTVIVLEDLHWAGDVMLAFTERLLATELGSPVLILMTARFELVTPVDRLSRTGEVRELRLSSLDDEAIGRLLTAVTEGLLDRSEAPAVLEQIAGNPLYAEQYARLLLERSSEAPEPHGDPHAGLDGAPLPPTLRAVLAARVDSLPGREKALLCEAAVLGETFWRGALVALSGLDEPVVDAALSVFLTRDFVRPAVSSSLEGETQYVFWHALTREAAYDRLPRIARARRHEAAARWLDAVAGERVSDVAEVRAFHLTTALGLARSARDEELATRLVGPTVDALTIAGVRALSLDAGAAERWLSQALELVGEARSPELLRHWAECQRLLERPNEMLAPLQEAIPELLAQGDARNGALALLTFAEALQRTGSADFVAPDELALSLVEGDGGTEEAKALLAVATDRLLALDSDPESVLPLVETAVDVARRSGSPGLASCLAWRGFLHCAMGDATPEDFWRVAEAARSEPIAGEVCDGLGGAYQGLSCLVGLRETRPLLDEALDIARARGLGVYVVFFRGIQAEADFLTGRWDAALAADRAIEPESTAGGDVFFLLQSKSLDALMFHLQGDTKSAAEILPVLRDLPPNLTADNYRLIPTAAVMHRLGEQGEALALLQACRPDHTFQPDVRQTALLCEGMRTAIACGDPETAARLMDGLQPAMLAYRLILQTGLAMQEESEGRHFEAARSYETAARDWRDFGIPYEEAQALLGRGRCLVRLGREKEAGRPLGQAREVFARLGARPSLGETTRLLEETRAS